MSYEEYLKYRKDGISPYKFPWVKKAWDNLDLTKEQYVLIRRNSKYAYLLGLGIGTLFGISLTIAAMLFFELI